MKNKQTKKANVPKKSKKTKQTANNTAVGQALRALGGLGGGAAGAMFGRPIAGQSLGTGLGAALSKWLGFGDYAVSRNTLVEKASSGIPMMHKTGQSVLVRHKEFIGTLSGSSDFTVQKTLTINPGLSGTFPWLSGIAGRFGEYEVKGMVYHYIPTSGTFNGATAALGSVMFQTSYRSTDTAPANKAEMMNEYWAGEVVPCESMVHPIECDPKENPFAVHYVRTNIVEGSEPLLYDLGTTFVATQGMVDTAIIGDLWVTYEIELKKPVVASNAALKSDSCELYWTGMETGNIFNGSPTIDFGSTNLTFTSGNKIVVPKRTCRYVVQFRADPATSFAGAAGTTGWPNPVVLTGGLTLYGNNVGGNTGSSSAMSANSLWYRFGVSCLGVTGGTVTIPDWSMTGAAARMTLTIIEIPF